MKKTDGSNLCYIYKCLFNLLSDCYRSDMVDFILYNIIWYLYFYHSYHSVLVSVVSTGAEGSAVAVIMEGTRYCTVRDMFL